MTYSFAVLRAALRPDGCAPRRAALAAAPDTVADRFDALLDDDAVRTAAADDPSEADPARTPA